ncbi:hypothetical protein FKM82_029794 [Ascaphus truei]
MICAAVSGVPCLRSCPLMDRTLSLHLSFPSFAARPPSNRSRTKTPTSSVFRTSLMPSGSSRSLLSRATWMTSLLGLAAAVPSARGAL